MVFDALRIASKRHLRECTLLKLGRVNVVCGRNSSGKSTFLEGVTDRNTRFPGATFGPSDAGDFFVALERTGGWGKGVESSESALLGRLIDQIFASPRRLFLDQHPLIAEEIAQAFRESPLRRWAFSTSPVKDVFEHKLPNDAAAVLIPPKRHLEPNCLLDSNASVHANGLGLVNFLFYAKNQPYSSREWTTQNEMATAFREISKGFVFDTFLNKNNYLDLRFAKDKRNWVAATEAGLGLQDLLIILYFAIAPEYDLVCVEEPESHMHPELQRRLLGFLRARDDKQFFLSTHSNVFLDNAFVDRVFFTSFTEGAVRVTDATSKASILDDLGYSVADNLVSDVVVLVEGPSDGAIIEEFLVKKGALPRFSVKVWPLGGDIMDQLDLSVLAQGNRLIALIDRDPKSGRVRERFAEKCAHLKIPVTRLQRYSIENYFALPAIRVVLPGRVPSTIVELEPDQPVDKQIGFSIKRNGRAIAKEMSLADVANTDFERFIDSIVELCETTED